MANKSGYSGSQILAMQKDAVRRVNEMQRIAQERLRQTASAMNGGDPPPTAPPSPPAAANEQTTPTPSVPSAEGELLPGPMQGILDRLGLDTESILLLMLLLLMINEGADSSLVLALVYILL